MPRTRQSRGRDGQKQPVIVALGGEFGPVVIGCEVELIACWPCHPPVWPALTETASLAGKLPSTQPHFICSHTLHCPLLIEYTPSPRAYIAGVEFLTLTLNTDAQHLSSSLSPARLQKIGTQLTPGLGEFPTSDTDFSFFVRRRRFCTRTYPRRKGPPNLFVRSFG